MLDYRTGQDISQENSCERRKIEGVETPFLWKQNKGVMVSALELRSRILTDASDTLFFPMSFSGLIWGLKYLVWRQRDKAVSYLSNFTLSQSKPCRPIFMPVKENWTIVYDLYNYSHLCTCLPAWELLFMAIFLSSEVLCGRYPLNIREMDPKIVQICKAVFLHCREEPGILWLTELMSRRLIFLTEAL